jgi:enoyl-CoA hydratase/carnithine racemase
MTLVYQDLIFDVDDPVATITLNRPEKLNAMTDRTLRELSHALASAEADERVVGIVLTGAGRAFCAGLDMQSLNAMQEAGTMAAIRTQDDVPPSTPGAPRPPDFAIGSTYLMAIRKPLIVAINGACAGLGFSIAMMCDMRFIAEGAFLTTAFAQRGLVAEHGMSWVLPRLIGASRALDVLWSGRRVSAAEAAELGLVNRVVSEGDVVVEAADYIRQLAATASPNSLRHMKLQVYADLQQRLGPAMEHTIDLQEQSSQWPDLKEGVASFTERRPPNFERLAIDNGLSDH